ncbi:MAG: GNAT family N-acetyltransferase [Cyclobacteriaceae bacterium]
MMPGLTIHRVGHEPIAALRVAFLSEHPVQIRYEACHLRSKVDYYLMHWGGAVAGYACLKGFATATDRDSLFEWYVLPPFRAQSTHFFREVLRTCRPEYIESQSNVPQLTWLLYRFATGIRAETVLFLDHRETSLESPDTVFRRRSAGDTAFVHTSEPVGDFVLESAGVIVATGGFLLHYNPPFADLYMEVHPDYRRRGYGSFLLQEIKRACYAAGRAPAARCHIDNEASFFTLLKAGFQVAGQVLSGTVEAQHITQNTTHE